MKAKVKAKIAIDGLMILLLLLLMMFPLTGQEFHEWMGAGMLALFLVHNILNFKWYKGLAKGTYTSARAAQTVLNCALLVCMLALAWSGMTMSGYVFDFLPASGAMGLARRMHMAASYWGFVLMSLHLGFHWFMVTGAFGRRLRDGKRSKGVLYALRISALAAAVWGAICFVRADLLSYMLVRNPFVFFDFEKTALRVLAENAGIMELWAFLGYYFVKWRRNVR